MKNRGKSLSVCVFLASALACSALGQVSDLKIGLGTGSKKYVLSTFVAPAYPMLARQAQIQGTVELTMEVDPKGVPVNLSTKGHPFLRQAVEDAAKLWRFDRNDITIAHTCIEFKLQGDKTDAWRPTIVRLGDGGCLEVITNPGDPVRIDYKKDL